MPSQNNHLHEDLRRVLLSAEDALGLEVRGAINAAVLVPLYVHRGRLHAVFTFEANEEIGLPGDAVEIVGALQPTPTIATGYAVYPFVGLIDAGRTWTPSANEVAEVLELPLDALLAGYGRRRLVRRGVPIRTDTYVVGDHLIWGATARILADLFDRIGPLLKRTQAGGRVSPSRSAR